MSLAMSKWQCQNHITMGVSHGVCVCVCCGVGSKLMAVNLRMTGNVENRHWWCFFLFPLQNVALYEVKWNRGGSLNHNRTNTIMPQRSQIGLSWLQPPRSLPGLITMVNIVLISQVHTPTLSHSFCLVLKFCKWNYSMCSLLWCALIDM